MVDVRITVIDMDKRRCLCPSALCWRMPATSPVRRTKWSLLLRRRSKSILF
jgi:hypothetical protein